MKKIRGLEFEQLPLKVRCLLIREYGINSDCWSDGDFIAALLDINDSNDIDSQFKQYMSRKGPIYAWDTNKEPSAKKFREIYFGDEYGWDIPSVYICENKKRAKDLYTIFKELAYHNTFLQTWVDVDLRDNVVLVFSGDY